MICTPIILKTLLKASKPADDVSFSFGVKHSAYLYDGNRNGSSMFRSRSGTYTKA